MTTNSPPLQQLSDDLAALVERVAPTTVWIHGSGQRPTTGTIVGSDFVVAVDHVIGEDDPIAVRTHDDRSLTGSLVGRDTSHDLALIKVPDLRGAPLEPAPGDARVGDLLVSVCRTWRGRLHASVGVVAALGGPVRLRTGLRLERFLRADVGSRPGISGSPLVGASGRLVAVVNAGLAHGVPLGLPAATVSSVVQTLAAHGRVRRGFLGVGLQAVAIPPRQSPDAGHGLLVMSIQAGGPADAAGLLVGDVIVAAAGTPIDEVDDLQPHLNGEHIGHHLILEVVRGAQRTSLDIVIGERMP